MELHNPFNERTTIQWDALDRELKKTLANGMTVSHLYDAAGRGTALQNRRADGTALAIYTEGSTTRRLPGRLPPQRRARCRSLTAFP